MDGTIRCSCSFTPDFAACEGVIKLPCRLCLGKIVYVVTEHGQIDSCVVIGAYDKNLNGNLLIITKSRYGNRGYDLSPEDKNIVWFSSEVEAAEAASNIRRIRRLSKSEKN